MPKAAAKTKTTKKKPAAKAAAPTKKPAKKSAKKPKVNYSPGLAGVIAARSAISFVDGEKGLLEYRGIPVMELVKHSTFEEVVFLLMNNHLPSAREMRQFNTFLGKQRSLPTSVKEALAKFPVGMPPMAALQAGITLLAGEDFYADDVSSNVHNMRRCISLIAKVPTIIAAFDRSRNGEPPMPPQSKYTLAENFLFMLTGDPPNAENSKAFDKLLIMHAEHTMNASTFACRVVGSTMGSVYSAVSGAVGALSGPLHGGANERVLRMLFSIGHPDNVEEFVAERMETGTRIMGIGHRIYKVKDPRASILQKELEKMVRSHDGEEFRILYKTATRLEEVLKKHLGAKKLYPNVDFYSGILLDQLAVPADLFTAIFALSRSVGWCAHWLEQVSANRLYRPSQEYIGDHNRKWLPMNKR
jgi:2-methylcitrate synthase